MGNHHPKVRPFHFEEEQLRLRIQEWIDADCSITQPTSLTIRDRMLCAISDAINDNCFSEEEQIQIEEKLKLEESFRRKIIIKEGKRIMHKVIRKRLTLPDNEPYPKITNVKDDNPEYCSICMNEHPKTQCLITQCGHYFGQLCITKYFIYKDECDECMNFICPLCVQNVNNVTFFENDE